jgi:hypothetical protein
MMDLIQTLVKIFILGKGRGKKNVERAIRRRIGKAGVI